MILKPEKIIKRIIKAVGQRQSVLIIGDWPEELTKGLKENQNTITTEPSPENLKSNSFTRIVAEYSLIENYHQFFNEIRRLLLPTGIIIISANCELNFLEKFMSVFSKVQKNKHSHVHTSIRTIKPKVLQDLIHDNGFLIEGYYGYPGGHLLMMAQIQNKEVSTLFASQKQETLHV